MSYAHFVILCVLFCRLSAYQYSSPHLWGQEAPACDGPFQSPINIVTLDAVVNTDLTPLTTTTSPLARTHELENLAKTVEVVTSNNGVLNGWTLLHGDYRLLQFHYHSPSEHTVNGNHYPMEVHYVHVHSDGAKIAVVGFFFEITSTENASIETILETLANTPVGSHRDIVMSAGFPGSIDSFWNYQGSLTTPPCTPQVEWFVSKDIIGVTQNQLDALSLGFGDSPGGPNNRPVQSLGNRVVYQHEPTFNYASSGLGSPSTWSTLFPVCGGNRQSPIDIVPESAQSALDGTTISTTHPDGATDIELVHLQYTVEVELHSADYSRHQATTYVGGDYSLLQFHVHAPSEHTVNGNHYDLEIHYVHAHLETGQLKVFGVFYDVGSDSASELADIIDNLDSIPNVGDHKSVRMSLDFETAGEWWNYRGSLTTPPCSEIVDWFVYSNVKSITSSDLQDIVSVLGVSNNRPVQPMNGRALFVVNDEESASFVLFPALFLMAFNLLFIML